MMTAAIRMRKLSCVLTVALFILCYCKAAPLGQSAKAEKATTQPLRYRMIVSEPSVCLNDPISLELELENVSSRRILVDPRALLHSVTIFREGGAASREGGASQSTGDLVGKISPEQLVALEPGQSHRETSSYPLHSKFFTIGLYSIDVSYGQFFDPSPEFPDLYKGIAESNTVLFEIKHCE